MSRKVIFISILALERIIENYRSRIGCIFLDGRNVGKKDGGNNKEIVDDILKLKTTKRRKSGNPGKDSRESEQIKCYP